jgi:folate-binding protein YgfZ
VDALEVPRAFVRVTGPDAEPYLQGQLSQDISAEAGLSWLLDPTGKAVAFLRFGRIDEGFLLDTDPEAGDAVVGRLRRFLLRTKAEVDLVDDVHLVRAFGASPLSGAAAVVAWPPGEGVQDLLVSDPAAALAAVGAEPLDPAAYQRRRILAGVPVSGVDITGDTIPAEAGRWTIESGVSFTKGCYTGQELVARIDSRGGNVPRPLRVLQFEAAVERDGEVLDGGGTSVGRLTSAAGDVAMGPIARKVEVGHGVTVGGVAGTVVR